MASGLMRCQRLLFLSALLIYVAMQKISAITSDGEAVLSFKISIVGSDGIFQQWRQEDSDPCIWSGVTCDNHTRRVIRLNLSYHKLIGSISPDIGKPSKLKLLALHGNSLYGYIPPKIGNCREL